jgi:polyhydroxyalkanoate synthase
MREKSFFNDLGIRTVECKKISSINELRKAIFEENFSLPAILKTAESEKIHFNIKKLENVIGYAPDDKKSLGIWNILNSDEFIITDDLFPEKLKSLTVYVTPYDFSDKGDCMLYKWTKDIDVDAMVDNLGIIPADMLGAGFSSLKPSMDISKYFGVMDMMGDEAKMTNFLRMEKWKADTPDLAGEMFRKYIKDLFRDNKLIKGEMTLGGKKVDLKNLTMPFLNVYATEDNIIPNTSTIPVNDAIGSKDKELYAFPGGHIGVFVGAKSQKELAPKVAQWVMSKS